MSTNLKHPETARTIDRASGRMWAELTEFDPAQRSLILAELVAMYIADEPPQQHEALLGRHIRLVDASLSRADAEEESLEQE